MTRQRISEVVASVATIYSTLLGTTTLPGVTIGFVANVLWWWLMIEGRLWGLAPLNAGMLVVLVWNLSLACTMQQGISP